jgi:acetyltransferase
MVGGPGTICVDELAASGEVRLAHLSEPLKARLRQLLVPAATVGQPDGYIDMTGSVSEALHEEIFSLLLAEEGIDAIVYLTTPPAFLDQEKLARHIAAAYHAVPAEQRKPVLPVLLFGDSAAPARRILEQSGLPTFEFPDTAARVVAHMVRYARYRRRAGA